MSLEAGSFISDLNQSNPPGTDKKKQGDDHLRLIKAVLRATLPNGDRAQYFPRGLAASSDQVLVAADMEKSYVIDATAAGRTVTLPTLAAGNDGWMINVAKSDSSANTVTIAGTINGGTDLVLTRRWEGALVLWTGAAWVGLRHISSVGTNDIESNAITNAKMADDAINTAEIVALAVTSAKLADNSVTTAKINDGQVTNVKTAGPRRTTQYLTSGTAAIYTTPANCKSIVVYIKGAGGGGSRSQGGNTTGAQGGTTTFNGITAIGGLGGSSQGGGVGGSGGSGSAARFNGSGGQRGGNNGGGFDFAGGGAPGHWGQGAGVGGDNSGVSSTAGAANTGAGGGGDDGGGGGGSGELAIVEIQSPAATYTYTITAGGAGSGSGTSAGGSGVIVVEEYY